MSLLDLTGYAADAAILGTYALIARRPGLVRWFHWANAIGAVPVCAVELASTPVPWAAFVLTASFGAIGWIGVLHRAPGGRRRFAGRRKDAGMAKDLLPEGRGFYADPTPVNDPRSLGREW